MSAKILVIEDEATVLQNTLEILSMEGFEVRGEENGKLGIQAAMEYAPDLIICDIMMPGMDGYAVLENLRKFPNTALTPFVFLTARTDRRDQRYGMNLGADDYLTKPFTVAELLQCVAARLDRSETIADDAEKKLDTLRDNIILSMPHELRTPLTSILGFSDLLRLDAASMDSEQIVQMSELINKAAIRLSHLIENYLAFAQTDILLHDTNRRQKFINARSEQANLLIRQESERMAADADRAADLQLNIAPADLKLSQESLKKIVSEVVSNAFKFSPPAAPVVVEGKISGATYRLRVSDQGRGMQPEYIAQMGAYMQFERELYEQQGSGLGLIIARRLAEMHGGELTIESVPTQHTTVTVTLPLA